MGTTLPYAMESPSHTKGKTMHEYQVINKQTGEVIDEGCFANRLEWKYLGLGYKYFMRNTTTGIEWDMPQSATNPR
jgi:hypothetical protein